MWRIMSQIVLFQTSLSLALAGWAVPAQDVDQGSTSARAASISSDSRSVLVFQVAIDKSSRNREEKFIEELRLAQDELAIVSIEPPTLEFAQTNLSQQLEVVQPLLEEYQAIAAIWFIRSATSLKLHFVEASSGRAVARLVEVELVEGAETDLATAAIELLNTVVSPAREHGPGEPTPTNPQAAEATPPENSAPKESKRVWRLAVYGSFEGGIAGHVGPNTVAGGAIYADWALLSPLAFRLMVGGFGGYLDRTGEADVNVYCLAGGFGALLRWRIGSFALGPVLELQLGWWNTIAGRDGKPDETFAHFSLKGAALFETSWFFTERVGLLLAGGIGVYKHRESFELGSNGKTVLKTPFAAWEGRLGLAIEI